MSHVTFKRVTPDDSRIYDAEGEYVDDVHAHDDILHPGRRVYLVHLWDDPRGWSKVHEREGIREVASERLLTHPLR